MMRREKRIAELHTDYESMVKFFEFAVKNAETQEDKSKFKFHLKLCESMKIVLEHLFELSELSRKEKEVKTK